MPKHQLKKVERKSRKGYQKMIKGTGIDLVSIPRFNEALNRRGRRLLEKVFTPAEREACCWRAYKLAGRFAAKEAFFKALGSGFRGFKWHDLEVRNDELGAPYLHFSPRLAGHLEAQGITCAHLSISHDQEYAIAQVILEG
ncbi:MAG TPA: holo-ACP synthase [Bacillota bacterium]